MVSLMCGHIPQDARIHYVITASGQAPNIVPESAEVHYYVRHLLLAKVTLPNPTLPLGSQAEAQPVRSRQNTGSTDMGDVSWMAPELSFACATRVPGTPAHSWQAVVAGGMSIDHKGIFLAGQLFSLTAVELVQDARLIEGAWAKLRRKRGAAFACAALQGELNPPLGYRLQDAPIMSSNEETLRSSHPHADDEPTAGNARRRSGPSKGGGSWRL